MKKTTDFVKLDDEFITKTQKKLDDCLKWLKIDINVKKHKYKDSELSSGYIDYIKDKIDTFMTDTKNLKNKIEDDDDKDLSKTQKYYKKYYKDHKDAIMQRSKINNSKKWHCDKCNKDICYIAKSYHLTSKNHCKIDVENEKSIKK